MATEEEPKVEGLLVITAVEQERKERQRYLLYANGGDEPVASVHEDLLVKFRLLKGREIDAADLERIIVEDGKHRAYVSALAYLGARPRTNKEILRYLSRKGTDEQAAGFALERLRNEGLVDDAAYAQQFASERMRNQLKGRRLLRQELEQRGIARETAKEASESLDAESETEIAIRAAVKKWPSINGEYRDRKRKLTAFLLRRGFPSSAVKRAIQEAARQAEEDEAGWKLDN